MTHELLYTMSLAHDVIPGSDFVKIIIRFLIERFVQYLAYLTFRNLLKLPDICYNSQSAIKTDATTI